MHEPRPGHQRRWLVALALAAALAVPGCRTTGQARTLPEPAAASRPTEPATDQAPRYPTPEETAQARATRVLGGYSISLPAKAETCWNGSVVDTEVECLTRDQVVQGFLERDGQFAAAPAPAGACPALCIAWRGGRSIMEASPDPGLFDPGATRDARRREPATCCYRLAGRCPGSPSENAQ